MAGSARLLIIEYVVRVPNPFCQAQIADIQMMVREPFPRGLSVQMVESRFSGFDAMQQGSPRLPCPFLANDFRSHSQRAWNIAEKPLRARREAKARAVLLGENPHAGQCAEKTVQSVLAAVCRSSQIPHRFGPFPEVVRHAQFGSHGDHLGYPITPGASSASLTASHCPPRPPRQIT